jgi:hypothetical protein
MTTTDEAAKQIAEKVLRRLPFPHGTTLPVEAAAFIIKEALAQREREIRAEQQAVSDVARRVGLLRKEKERANGGSRTDVAFIEGGLSAMENLLEDLVTAENDTIGDVRERVEELVATAIRHSEQQEGS